ncbi:hypothetical protein CXF94_17475 [Halomonas sp. Choline-3u-9]|nr:hypothetical protein CXF94_17475 [Halomonas sp. Choline-3u-9]
MHEIIKNFNPDLVFIFAETVDTMKSTNDEEGFEVTFKDIDSELEFTLTFTDKALNEQKIKEGEKYLITYSLNKDLEIKTIKQFEIYQKFNKIRCLCLGEGTIIDIKNLTGKN